MASMNSLLHITFLVSISIITFIPNTNSIVFNYPAVFNFGDSNSDTGNLVSAGFEELNPPNGQTYFQKPSGRYCDGRLIVDFLMDAMDLSFLNAYLDSIILPNFRRGSNFAAAGSTILPATASSVSPFSFAIQISQFRQFKAQILDLASKSKFFDLVSSEDSFSKGLFMFDIGQNDIAGAFYSKTFDQVIASIPTILVEFESSMTPQRLYDGGARNFWIHNTGPLGCLTQNVVAFGTDPSKLDELGCVTAHNQAAKLFNLQLQALCKKIQGQYTDANVTYVDISHWDGIQYTEAVNQYVASQILTGKYSDPPISDKTPFNLKLKLYSIKKGLLDNTNSASSLRVRRKICLSLQAFLQA